MHFSAISYVFRPDVAWLRDLSRTVNKIGTLSGAKNDVSSLSKSNTVSYPL